MHVDPEEAIKIHYDLKSKMSFGIHWAAFKLTLGRLIYEFQTFCLSRNLFTFFTKTKYKIQNVGLFATSTNQSHEKTD